MTKRQPDAAERPDDDNPELTRAELRGARPAAELLPGLIGKVAANALLRRRGRPPKPDKKVNQTLRLDPDVLDAYRQQGKGWQTRINQVLRDNIPARPK